MGTEGIRDVLNTVDVSREAERHGSKGAICCQPASPGHHGNTAVLELSLAHPVESGDTLAHILPRRRLDKSGEVLRDRGEVEWVKAEVSYHASVKVDWTGKEGHSLGTLGFVDHAIPHTLRHGRDGTTGLTASLRCKGGGRGGQEGGKGGSEALHFSSFYSVHLHLLDWIGLDRTNEPKHLRLRCVPTQFLLEQGRIWRGSKRRVCYAQLRVSCCSTW